MRKLITYLLIVPMLVVASSLSAQAELAVGVIGPQFFSLSGGHFIVSVDAGAGESANAYSIDMLFNNFQGIGTITSVTKTDLMDFPLNSLGSTPDGSVSNGTTINYGRSQIGSSVPLSSNELFRVDFAGNFQEGDSFDVTLLDSSVFTNVIFEMSPSVTGSTTFTATAVPEPSTTAMMGIACAAIGGCLVWRRRRLGNDNKQGS